MKQAIIFAALVTASLALSGCKKNEQSTEAPQPGIEASDAAADASQAAAAASAAASDSSQKTGKMDADHKKK